MESRSTKIVDARRNISTDKLAYSLGGAVTATMYVPLMRSQVWQQITDYPRWVQYFPDVTKSEVLQRGEAKRLYQAAQKAFLFFTDSSRNLP